MMSRIRSKERRSHVRNVMTDLLSTQCHFESLGLKTDTNGDSIRVDSLYYQNAELIDTLGIVHFVVTKGDKFITMFIFVG